MKPVRSPISTEPVASRLDLRADTAGKVRIIRHDVNHGYITARNTMAREAGTGFILFLDDDTELCHPAVIKQAVDVMQLDSTVAAVGCNLPDGRVGTYQALSRMVSV